MPERALGDGTIPCTFLLQTPDPCLARTMLSGTVANIGLSSPVDLHGGRDGSMRTAKPLPLGLESRPCETTLPGKHCGRYRQVNNVSPNRATNWGLGSGTVIVLAADPFLAGTRLYPILVSIELLNNDNQ